MVTERIPFDRVTGVLETDGAEALIAEILGETTQAENSRARVAETLTRLLQQCSGVHHWANARDWGLTTSVSNPAAIINQAIQDCYTEGWGLSIDPGTYLLEVPIEYATYSSGWITGQLPPIRGSVWTKPKVNTASTVTKLEATYDDGPVLFTQGSRGAKLEFLHLVANTLGTTSGQPSETVENKVTNEALYQNATADQWKPQCVVAIDPCGVQTDQAGRRYSTIDSSRYSATNSQSSDITIRNCLLEGAEVAVTAGLGVSANSDGVLIEDTDITKCRYAVSAGHSQTKNIRLRNTSTSDVWQVAANNIHGQQNARMPIIESLGQSSVIGTIFGTPHPSSPCYFLGGPHTEVVGSLGTFAGTGTSTPVVFRDASFNMYGTDTQLSAGGRVVLVENCTFFMGTSGHGFKVECTCDDDLPGTWDGGAYSGEVRGAEIIFRNTTFGASTTGQDLDHYVNPTTDEGTTTAARADWIRFVNCLTGAGATSPYSHLLNGRAGAMNIYT